MPSDQDAFRSTVYVTVNGSWVVTSAESMTSGSAVRLPSAATTKVDGNTSEAAACAAGEKSAIAYGLKPVSRPARPSSPMTTVPAAGGEVGTDVSPVGVIGSGRPGGVHAPISSRTAPARAQRRIERRPLLPLAASTASPYGVEGGLLVA